MIDYEIYSRTHEGGVIHEGTVKGVSFEDACARYRKENPPRGYNPPDLYPSYIEASGYENCKTVDRGTSLELWVGDEILFDCQMRPAPEALGLGAAVMFPSADYLASRMRTMVDKLNYERFRERCEG